MERVIIYYFGIKKIYTLNKLIVAYKLHIQTSLVDCLYGQTTFLV